VVLKKVEKRESFRRAPVSGARRRQNQVDYKRRWPALKAKEDPEPGKSGRAGGRFGAQAAAAKFSFALCLGKDFREML